MKNAGNLEFVKAIFFSLINLGKCECEDNELGTEMK